MSDDSVEAVPATHGVPLADIPSDRPLLVKLGEDELLIVKQGSDFLAVGAKCTHMGASLNQGLVEDGQIRCPWHHARFCLRTGAAVGAPAFEPLQRFDTRIEGERLYVRKASAAPPPKRSTERPRRVVVIGAGAGGYACADMLVKLGFNGTLTVVNSDRDMPYDRTMCSKEYLAGSAKRTECFLPNEDMFADAQGTEIRAALLQQTVTNIDVRAREVVLDTGERLGFDSLVLACGAEPEQPSIPGLDSERLHVLRSLRDADHIIDQAKGAGAVAILGASFIGLEAAASLRQRKLEVAVVAPESVPLSKSVGSAVGSMIQKVHERRGIVFHLGRKLKSYDGKTATLDDGSSVDADFLVAGTGVSPRTQLAKDAGIEVASADEGGGVLVDQRLETSEPGIFAIGDIARYPEPATGERIRVEHWVHAQRQGQFVARFLMGKSSAYEDAPFFWSAHFDTSLSYVGHVAKPEHSTVSGNIDEQDFAIEFTDREGGKALVTCGRDLNSLRTEAAWERPGD